MKSIPKFEDEDRNAANFLALSLKYSEEYFDELHKLRKKYTETEIQLSKELMVVHRALWTSLIVEIRKLFGASFKKYENYSLREISFFKNEPYKKIVNHVYGSKIIQEILTTSHTFTIHLGKKKMKILPVDEICKSDLKQQIKKLHGPVTAFEEFVRNNERAITINSSQL